MKRGGGPVARQSGGMRQSFGGMSSLDGERMEEQAVQGATQQKAVAQQSSNAGTKSQPKQNAKKPPRDVSSLSEELLKRPAQDVSQELKSLFDLNALLGINRDDTPEEKAKKKQLHQRYQQLTQAEQQVAKERYQKELQKKQEEEKNKQQKEQEEREQEASALPSVGKVSKRGTALMGGSKKKKAAAQMVHDRQRIGKVAGAN